MSLRKAPNNGRENLPKRQRLAVEGAPAFHLLDTVTSLSFCSLPTDCKVCILAFLPNKDKDSVSECNRDCRQVRANASLDQDRTGTLVWVPRKTTMKLFCAKLREVQDKFTGNRTTLKITGLDKCWVRHGLSTHDIERKLNGVSFQSVTSLDCSSDDHGRTFWPLYALSQVISNLSELDLSYTSTEHISEAQTILQSFCETNSSLAKLKWNHYRSQSFPLLACGSTLVPVLNLTHLHLDSVCFYLGRTWVGHHLPERQAPFLMMHCHHLEYLSLKDATFRPMEGEFVLSEIALPQEMLIKMVRHHPTLRWLRSDLTAENVAMLKLERPEITFVSE